jgi:hypothetical protein
MDNDDDMMIHHFMEEQDNAAADEDDHLKILACLLQLQANQLRNVAPSFGGSKFGRRKSKERQRMEGHAMLYAD